MIEEFKKGEIHDDKKTLVDNIDFIREEYDNYIRQEVSDDYMSTKLALKIMYADGNFQPDFQRYFTNKRKMKKEKIIHEGRIIYLVL